MIQLVVGTSEQTQEWLFENLQNFREKGVHINTLHAEDLEKQDFQDLVSSGSNIFGETEVFVIKNSFSVLDVSNILSHYQNSENSLIFLEEKLLKKERTLFEENNFPAFEYPKIKKTKPEYNIFNLADLLGRRDKKNLWLDYRNAISQASPEEIHGILFWQIKNMILVKSSSVNPGLSPFVYKKNQTFVKNYSLTEIKKLSNAMINIFHRRDSYSTLDIELEKIILSL